MGFGHSLAVRYNIAKKTLCIRMAVDVCILCYICPFATVFKHCHLSVDLGHPEVYAIVYFPSVMNCWIFWFFRWTCSYHFINYLTFTHFTLWIKPQSALKLPSQRLHLCRGVRHPPPIRVLDMTLNNLMVRFQ